MIIFKEFINFGLAYIWGWMGRVYGGVGSGKG